jgi:hypothetical protein
MEINKKTGRIYLTDSTLYLQLSSFGYEPIIKVGNSSIYEYSKSLEKLIKDLMEKGI